MCFKKAEKCLYISRVTELKVLDALTKSNGATVDLVKWALARLKKALT
jgi:hypothetical protein